MTIWKFVVPDVGANIIKMPAGSQILSAQYQCRKLTIWAVVHSAEVLANRVLYVAGTGFPLPSWCLKHCHIATVQDGALVWHVFDGGEQ